MTCRPYRGAAQANVLLLLDPAGGSSPRAPATRVARTSPRAAMGRALRCAVRNLRLWTDLRNRTLLTLISESPTLAAFARLHAIRNRLLGRKDSFRDLLNRALDEEIYEGLAT